MAKQELNGTLEGVSNSAFENEEPPKHQEAAEMSEMSEEPGKYFCYAFFLYLSHVFSVKQSS